MDGVKLWLTLTKEMGMKICLFSILLMKQDDITFSHNVNVISCSLEAKIPLFHKNCYICVMFQSF